MLFRRVQGDGGCIAVDRFGNVGVHFTTKGMAWAYCTAGKLHYGVYHDEDTVVPVSN